MCIEYTRRLNVKISGFSIKKNTLACYTKVSFTEQLGKTWKL